VEVTDILLLKLLLTPLLIAALTVIGRRRGPAVSGAIAGLPLTSGPVSVFLAIEQGKDFASHAAVATLAGLIPVAAFCFAYSRTASEKNWIGSTFAGLAAFFVSAFLLRLVPLGLVTTLIIVVAFLAIVFRAMPTAAGGFIPAVAVQPKWDLPLRIGIATALVFLLTALAPKLGSQTTGLVSPFPIFGGVLAVFAHRNFGAHNAQRILRSVVLASFAFAIFFLIVGAMLVRFSCGITYSLAAMAALLLNALLFTQLRGK
jgi:hypothetical protein